MATNRAYAAFVAFRHVETQARKTRDVAEAAAWEALDAALAAPREPYQNAMAAWKVHRTAMRAAGQAYEATLSPAREAYRKVTGHHPFDELRRAELTRWRKEHRVKLTKARRGARSSSR